MGAPVGTPRGFAAILLAAGRSSRMGGPNKLLQDYAGEPLVRHAAKAALGSGAHPVLVVTGHQDAAVRQALAGLVLGFVHNPDFAEGLSTSLKAGVAALPEGVDAAAIVLGDMPLVGAELIAALGRSLLAQQGPIAAVPVLKGEWGNPVVLSRALFPAVSGLSGDAGARRLLQGRRHEVVEVPVSDDAVALDVDTPDALRELLGRGARSSPRGE
jgi:molybdenum cofactor cytidylyltransferase